MEEPVQVYVVDPDLAFAGMAVQLAERVGLSARVFDTPAGLLAEFRPQGPTVLVLECLLPAMHGLELWKQVLARGQAGVAAVFVTSEADVPLAIEAMKQGASDVLTKPCSASKFTSAVQRAMAEAVAALPRQRELQTVAALLAQLSPRQRQIAELLMAGLSTRGVAEQLALAEKTIEFHRTNIFKQLGVTNLVQLIQLLSVTQPESAAYGSEPL